MDNNKKKVKFYSALLVTVLCIIGVSYAWFRLYLSQSESNRISARTCFDTTLTEDSAKISLDGAVPESDEKGLTETPFTFTLKNNCTGYIRAYITIDSAYRTSTSTSYLKDNKIKVNISPTGTTLNPSSLLTDKELIELEGSRLGYSIIDVGLNSNEEKTFDLRVWMDSSITVDEGLNKTWEGKIVVLTEAQNVGAPNGWNSAKDGTLLAAIRRDNTVKSPSTTPGSAISADTEALLASTEDDYGTSYYFRGAVTNNFVEYANMCWRIVRVTGDGSIKLVLYNYNGLTSTNNTPSSSMPCNVTGNDLAFARFDGDTYTSKFNSSYNDNAYIGLMYGTAGATSYTAAHANTNASTILTNLNKWYTNVLSKQANFKDSQLADTIWCNDKSVVTDTTFNPFSLTLGTNYGYATNANYYSAIKRLVQASSGTAGGTGPSLICPNDNNGGKLSKFTVSDTEYGNGNLDKKIGLLTADELALAGYASGLQNSTTYLQENATDYLWWSLSPFYFNGSNALVWSVLGSIGYFDSDYVGDAGGVRPSISLKSTTNVTGDGTSSSPYKIVS